MRLFVYIFMVPLIYAKAQISPGSLPYRMNRLNLELTSSLSKPVNNKPVFFRQLNTTGKLASCILKIGPTPLAFFCRMEDRSRNNFRIFLKIRMGDDESYLKMIRNE